MLLINNIIYRIYIYIHLGEIVEVGNVLYQFLIHLIMTILMKSINTMMCKHFEKF